MWPKVIGAAATLGALSIVGAVWYYFTPKYWRVGYMPSQPALSTTYVELLYENARRSGQPAPQVPGQDFAGFPHHLHAGKLGMDCRYCHSNVEHAEEANIPTVSTCMGCHAEGHVNDQLFARADRVQFIRDAWAEDASIQWRRVHKLPDYVRNFPHNVHVNAGVSCYSCHGNIMQQEVVHQVEPLSMGWCLDCHRDPTPHLVPKDKVTDLAWVAAELAQRAEAKKKDGEAAGGGMALLAELEGKPLHLLPANCGACHY